MNRARWCRTGPVALVGLDGELQPGRPGQAHLGPQAQHLAPLEGLDPPEVDGLAHRGDRSGSRRPRRRPTPPASRSSRPRTAQARGNEYQPRSPPMPSMACQSWSTEALTVARALVAVDGAAAPLGIGGHRVAGGARPLGARTNGSRRRRSGSAPGPGARPRRTRAGRWAPASVMSCSVDHDRVAQRLDEGLGDGLGHRRDQVDPLARQPRGEDPHGDDDPAPEAGGGRRSAASSPGRSGRRARRCRSAGWCPPAGPSAPTR